MGGVGGQMTLDDISRRHNLLNEKKSILEEWLMLADSVKQTPPNEIQRCSRCGDDEFFTENFLPSVPELVNLSQVPSNSSKETSSQVIDTSHGQHTQNEYKATDCIFLPELTVNAKQEAHTSMQLKRRECSENVCHHSTLLVKRSPVPTSKKGFECGKCGSKFSREKRYNAHIQKHLYFKCNKCGEKVT
ncbi:hypothetical protein AVEN_247487-1 [Araneus ventricosus]|uniref:C2H2-type domain-containing protein n=1 Tax=Araneus ventricosus TaxID=182803 RepID=A0A4Y2GV44_ARAVE|nr:hypothetical protein AVEN_247487-1 [Araneus ventricosus]